MELYGRITAGERRDRVGSNAVCPVPLSSDLGLKHGDLRRAGTHADSMVFHHEMETALTRADRLFPHLPPPPAAKSICFGPFSDRANDSK